MAPLLYKRGGHLSVAYDEDDEHEQPTAQTEAPDTWATAIRAPTRPKVAIRRELVKDLIPDRSIGFIGGQSGAFKTFVAMDTAAEIAKEGSIAGRIVLRPGGVVYLAYEGQGTIDERWAAICKDKRLSGNVPVYFVKDAPALDSEASYQGLEGLLGGIADDLEADGAGLRLVIVDTVNMAGMIPDDKENDATAWGNVYRRLRVLVERTGVSVALIHHAGKDVNSGLRGSSAAHAAADFVIMCEAERDPVTGKVTARHLHLRKSRYGVEGPIAALSGEAVPVTEDEAGDTVATLVMRYDTEAIYTPGASRTGGKLQGAAAAKAETKAQRWKAEIAANVEHFLRYGESKEAVGKALLRQATYDALGGNMSNDAKTKAFGRALDALIASGIIQEQGAGSVTTGVNWNARPVPDKPDKLPDNGQMHVQKPDNAPDRQPDKPLYPP